MNHVDLILTAMLAQIELHGLALMQRYPNDLLLHDRAILERAAHPGAVLGWMVGHSHTHTIPLGLHVEENKYVTYLTNLSSEDRFYVLRVDEKSDFSLKEITREGFRALAVTPVAYHRNGTAQSFWIFKEDDKIGYCSIVSTGEFRARKFIATITLVDGVGALDIAALYTWVSYSVVEIAGTLFCKYEIVLDTPLKFAA